MNKTGFSFLLLLFPVLLHAQDASSARFFVKLREGAAYQRTSSGVQFATASLESVARTTGVQSIGAFATGMGTLQKSGNGLERIVLVTLQDGMDIDAAMSSFASDANVEYVEPEHLYRLDYVPDDSAYGSQWGMQRIGMESAWDVTQGYENIIVGVIDTGIDYNHEDLKTQLWINTAEDRNGNGTFEPWSTDEQRDGISGDMDGIDNDGNGYTDDVTGYDFVNQPSVSNTSGGDYRDPDADPLDEQGHGSSVSGIIAAATGNGKGIAGIAPKSKIMTLRAFDARGVGTEGDVAQAIVYAVANGVTIINMSFGDVIYSRVLRDVVRYAYGRGVTMIASAGNSATDVLHYPSAYDETISVSAITEYGSYASFSNYGTSIDIAAPGSSIPSTDKNGRYTSSFNGTSASAPFVAGVAALIKARHPEFSPEEVRGILIASAEDLGTKGWDVRYGAGLLNAAKAVQQDDPSEVKIIQPKNDFASTGGEIAVIATAASPLMTGYTLQYGTGINPSSWKTLVSYTQAQFIADTIATLDIDQLYDTSYTLRLSAVSDNGMTLEDRVVIHIDRTAPVFQAAGFIPCWDGNSYGAALGFISDDPTLAKIWYRMKNSGAAWQWISMEPESDNNLFVATTHYRYIGAPELMPGNTYEIYMTAENEVGLVTTLRQGEENFELTLPVPVSSYGFTEKPYNAEYGRMSGVVSDFNNNGFPELLANAQTGSSDFVALEFNGNAMQDIAAGAIENKLPRAAGDVNGDGKPELLASIVRAGYLYESTTDGTVPNTLVWADTVSTAFWPVAIADVNNDSRNEVLAVIDDTTMAIYSFDQNFNPTQLAVLINTSPTSPYGTNELNSPKAAFGDFNGNGRRNILIGDYDADFLLFENTSGNTYTFIKGLANDYEDGGNLIASGDFDGDGRDEFALGFRTGEDDVIPYWFFGIFQLDGANTLQQLWSDNFYGVDLGTSYGLFTEVDNNISAGNIDTDDADELIISVYPELYIIDYNSQKGAFEPVWYLPLANSNATAIADFDQNGVNELAFSTIDSIVFYEKDVPYTGPPAPRSITVEYETPHQVQIHWTADVSAPQYRLYRGRDIASLAMFGEFDNTTVSDPSLMLDSTYIYAICAYDSTKTPKESPRLYTRILHPHAQPVVDSAVYVQQGQVQVYLSQDIGTVIPAVDKFSLGIGTGMMTPSSVVVADQRTLVLSFDAIEDGEGVLSIIGLRDGEGIPFPDNHIIPVSIQNTVESELYVVRVEYTGGRSFCVYFNMPVNKETAETATNYHVSPLGYAVSAVRDETDPTKVCFTLPDGSPIGAVGLEYVLKVTGVVSESGIPIVTGAGCTAGIILNRETLEDIFVYPNPWKPADGQDYITFANLTQEAVIRVYTFSGAFLAEITETDGNGGVQWDMRDEHGEKLPSGVYIYYVTGKNSAGQEVDPKASKFAIVR